MTLVPAARHDEGDGGGDGGGDYQDMNSVSSLQGNGTVTGTDDATATATGRSITAARFGIVKAMVGPAILYLPHSFADAGYIFAILALAAASLLYLYSSKRLLETWAFCCSCRQAKYNTSSSNSNSISTSSTGVTLTGVTGTAAETLYNNKKRKERMLDDHDDHDDDEAVEMVSLTIADKHEESKIVVVVVTDNNNTVVCKNEQHHAPPPRPATTTTIPTTFLETDNHGMPVLLPLLGVSNPSNISVSYPQLAQIAYGDVGETVVRTGITLMQLGICLTYFIFVPHNLSKSIETLLMMLFDEQQQVIVPPPSLWMCLVAMVLVEIPLSCGRDIRRLHPTNVLANALILFGLLSCLWLALFGTTTAAASNTTTTTAEEEHDMDSSTTTNMLEKMASLSPWNDQWYLFVGTSVSG
jgi:hypothetical protein